MMRIIKNYFRDIFINSIASSNVTPQIIRKYMYTFYGIKTQTRSIRPNCYFGNNKVVIGKNTTINGSCYFENLSLIKIGENCDIAMEVLFCTSTHEIGDQYKRAGKAFGKDIVVEDGCWVGARVTILPGVRIGKGCIIAANSVVTSDCEDNYLYAGIPAKKVRKLTTN
ncbi:acyltransferase [Exiguobacterium sp. s191]|uniref:acyltransferase n=1 Tax=Exiguobacterium sp. s191 TaxID=2751196 RepID=UPI001BEC2433|nr:acyltransferase [Exiguobacterium sp. s191]